MKSKVTKLSRRQFISTTAISMSAFSIISPGVLGLNGRVSPNNKLTFALIGCGTQGLRELGGMLSRSDVQVIAVCDPNLESYDYVDWSRDGLRAEIANYLKQPDWKKGAPGIPGGRKIGQEIVELYYSQDKASGSFKGCNSYEDFRELLEKEKDLDAVKIMTPDHLHATIAIAAMNKGKFTATHKPLANYLNETRAVIKTAKTTKAVTYFLPAAAGEQVHVAAEWIRSGAIGKLQSIHNWTNRPVWPQYTKKPEDTPPIPAGFNWDLWLGPCLPIAYHPNYTHAVFRGWYEFGGGAIADMGHYSLCRVFREFKLEPPIWVESTPSHVCDVVGFVSRKIHNDFSFPIASTVRFRFAASNDRPEIDIFWYDGGMRPATPDVLLNANKELPPEGIMYVGDRGMILGGFLSENLILFSGDKGEKPPQQIVAKAKEKMRSINWIDAFRQGKASEGDFLLAESITEAFNLAAISLRLGGKRLVWDSKNFKITNVDEANKYLTRKYRSGWEIKV